MLQHNFQGYEVRNDDESIPIIGFGISAISTISDGYAQNCINIEDYRQAILLKKAATSRGIIINYNDKLRREIIETLMCDMQVFVQNMV
jgi:oxygen-independent coproporphyrinogen-3 oxidase